MAKIDAFFKLMNEQGASDLHLVAGSPPALRIRGDIERIKYKILDNDDLRGMLYEIAPEQKIKLFEETGDIDFGYEIPGLARYRANFFMQKNGVGAVFREIPSTIMTAEQLNLPPVVSKLASLPRGLVLVTGPTGSGKSTTLAAIVDVSNRVRKDHIITVEDPIEFVHNSQGCIVNHREVGVHTESFSTALRGALREDPDIILVGEMRDLETISLAVEAASTGHLVFSTLHTSSAYKTVDRVIEVFPSHEQPLIRSTLFKGDDVNGFCFVDMVQNRGQRCRFTGSGGAGNKDEAVDLLGNLIHGFWQRPFLNGRNFRLELTQNDGEVGALGENIDPEASFSGQAV